MFILIFIRFTLFSKLPKAKFSSRMSNHQNGGQNLTKGTSPIVKAINKPNTSMGAKHPEGISEEAEVPTLEEDTIKNKQLDEGRQLMDASSTMAEISNNEGNSQVPISSKVI